MKRDQQILSEIVLLKNRIKKLNELLQLRAEVNRLEYQAMTGTSSKRAIKIISEVVCKKYQVDVQRLVSPGREQAVVVPRQLAFHLIRVITNIPFERIGEVFGRDHGTIMHACRSIADRSSTQPDFRKHVMTLESECRKLLDDANEAVNNLSASPDNNALPERKRS